MTIKIQILTPGYKTMLYHKFINEHVYYRDGSDQKIEKLKIAEAISTPPHKKSLY